MSSIFQFSYEFNFPVGYYTWNHEKAPFIWHYIKQLFSRLAKQLISCLGQTQNHSRVRNTFFLEPYIKYLTGIAPPAEFHTPRDHNSIKSHDTKLYKSISSIILHKTNPQFLPMRSIQSNNMRKIKNTSTKTKISTSTSDELVTLDWFCTMQLRAFELQTVKGRIHWRLAVSSKIEGSWSCPKLTYRRERERRWQRDIDDGERAQEWDEFKLGKKCYGLGTPEKFSASFFGNHFPLVFYFTKHWKMISVENICPEKVFHPKQKEPYLQIHKKNRKAT